MMTRRGFVKMGGALFVSAVHPWKHLRRPTRLKRRLRSIPTLLASWLEIRSDNTIVMRTGRTETGTGMSAYYAQAIAEELNVRPETISLILGDTDRDAGRRILRGISDGNEQRTEGGGVHAPGAAGIGRESNWVSPVSGLSVTDGIVSGGGKSISYGKLVEGQHLDLKIPVEGKQARPDPAGWVGMTSLDGFTVTGDPPMKPVNEFKVIGNIVSGAEHSRQGDGQDAVELRRTLPGDAACANGAARDAGLDAGLGWRSGQKAVSDRGSGEEGQPGGGGLAQ